MARLPELVETPRLALRRWTVRETAALHEAVTANVDHLIGYMHWAQHEPTSFDDRQALIEGWEAEWKLGRDTVYGAWLPSEDGEELVGCVGLHARLAPGSLEIGYWIDHRHLRKGFAREIASAATTAAFTLPEIDTVAIIHDQSNTASEGIPRTLGYTFEGAAPQGPDRPGPGLAGTGIECRWTVQRELWATPCMA